MKAKITAAKKKQSEKKPKIIDSDSESDEMTLLDPVADQKAEVAQMKQLIAAQEKIIKEIDAKYEEKTKLIEDKYTKLHGKYKKVKEIARSRPTEIAPSKQIIEHVTTTKTMPPRLQNQLSNMYA